MRPPTNSPAAWWDSRMPCSIDSRAGSTVVVGATLVAGRHTTSSTRSWCSMRSGLVSGGARSRGEQQPCCECDGDSVRLTVDWLKVRVDAHASTVSLRRCVLDTPRRDRASPRTVPREGDAQRLEGGGHAVGTHEERSPSEADRGAAMWSRTRTVSRRALDARELRGLRLAVHGTGPLHGRGRARCSRRRQSARCAASGSRPEAVEHCERLGGGARRTAPPPRCARRPGRSTSRLDSCSSRDVLGDDRRRAARSTARTPVARCPPNTDPPAHIAQLSQLV